MVAGDMSITVELMAALLTVLYIGKLLIQKDQIDRLFSEPRSHHCPCQTEEN